MQTVGQRSFGRTRTRGGWSKGQRFAQYKRKPIVDVLTGKIREKGTDEQDVISDPTPTHVTISVPIAL